MTSLSISLKAGRKNRVGKFHTELLLTSRFPREVSWLYENLDNGWRRLQIGEPRLLYFAFCKVCDEFFFSFVFR